MPTQAYLIDKVHVIFKTHLDIGFTDLAANVVSNYFQRDIPRAIETARTLRLRDGAERFVWTTGSWLIYEYLEQAAPTERKHMEDAIQAGDIVWHGLPFTTHSELMNPSLFRFGLSLSQTLDQRFGKKTIAAKMTDVPGHTRGIVPLMADTGLEFLHIGVNAASTPPNVPDVFVWRDVSGVDIMVMYHKGSYGESMLVPGMTEAISFAHTGDNLGPQSPEQVIKGFAKYRQMFPDAKIVASTMDVYAQALRPLKSDLPIVTDELGDTWIHGAGSDPGKMARFRELSRLRDEWLANQKVRASDSAFSAFSRFLILVPEHTWGLDVKTYLNDYKNYAADDFAVARKLPNFRKTESSWQEQRDYLDQAIQSLSDSRLSDEAQRRLETLKPMYPNLSGWQKVEQPDAIFETAHFRLQFDSVHGGLCALEDKATKRQWASAQQLIGQFRYQIFSMADYNRFWKQYNYNKDRADVAFWAAPDFSKPGIDSDSQTWLAHVAQLYQRRDQNGQHFLVMLNGEDEAVKAYGCPRTIALQFDLPDNALELYIDFQWFDKAACRLPEALWLSFVPIVSSETGWHLHKMGEAISPLEVIQDGNRKLHGIWEGVQYTDDKGQLSIDSLDAPLVAPGAPSLLNFNNDQPLASVGMHFNLFNNVWGTNFTMWYDEDARFRFALRFSGAI